MNTQRNHYITGLYGLHFGGYCAACEVASWEGKPALSGLVRVALAADLADVSTMRRELGRAGRDAYTDANT